MIFSYFWWDHFEYVFAEYCSKVSCTPPHDRTYWCICACSYNVHYKVSCRLPVVPLLLPLFDPLLIKRSAYQHLPLMICAHTVSMPSGLSWNCCKNNGQTPSPILALSFVKTLGQQRNICLCASLSHKYWLRTNLLILESIPLVGYLYTCVESSHFIQYENTNLIHHHAHQPTPF